MSSLSYEKNQLVVSIAQVVSGVLSAVNLIGAVAILFFLLNPRTSHHVSIGDGKFFLICLTICNAVTSIFIPIGILDQHGLISSPIYPAASCNSSILCVTQAFVTIWSANSTYLWTIGLQIFWFYSVWRGHVFQTVGRFLKVILVIMLWGLPLAISINALTYSVLGSDMGRSVAGWCWIASCKAINLTIIEAWSLSAGDLLEGASCLTIIIFLILSIFLLHRNDTRITDGTFSESEISTSMTSRLIRRYGDSSQSRNEFNDNDAGGWKFLYWIQIVFIVSHLWGACRLGFSTHIRITGKTSGPFVIIDDFLLIFQAIGFNIQPLLNLILLILFQRPVIYALRHHRNANLVIDNRTVKL